MANLKVNTNKVIDSANRMRQINNKLREEFGKVENAMRQLDNSWDGSAASNAMTKFNSIKGSYCNARYEAMDYYVRFLHEQVGIGYAETETSNKSLADAFK